MNHYMTMLEKQNMDAWKNKLAFAAITQPPLEKYKLQQNTMNFGQAIEALKQGKKAAREGWNGRGIHIALQTPDENSKMTHPYIYMDTTGLQTTNPAAPKVVIPWLASQTDMLSEDWIIL